LIFMNKCTTIDLSPGDMNNMRKLRSIKLKFQLSLVYVMLIIIIFSIFITHQYITDPSRDYIFYSSLVLFIVVMIMLRFIIKNMEAQVYHRARALNTANEKLEKAMEELKYTQKISIQVETQKSLTSIVSGFAHEINNPLTGILGYIDLMELNNELSPHSKRRLEGIKDMAIRIKDIIDDLNQLDPEIEQTKMEINLSNLLEKLIKIVAKENQDTGIQFETAFIEEEIFVYGNHFALWQVFMGIVENSIEAIGEKNVENGKIRVTLKKSPDAAYTVTEITDNGGGFENIDKAFNPFYTTKNRTQKKGIGLSIAFNLLQEHKGKIFIDNEDETGRRKRAKVTVILPFYQHDQAYSEADVNRYESEKTAAESQGDLI
jgi:signal transduction histidine kinase